MTFKIKTKKEKLKKDSMDTKYPNISFKELKEIQKQNSGKFELVKVPSYDGWRYALYTKGGSMVDVQKRSGQFAVSY